MHTVSTTLGYLRPVLRLLQEKGFSISALLEEHGIPVSGLLDGGQRVPVDVSCQLMALAARQSHPTPLWKALLKHAGYSDFGGLGMALEAGGNPLTVLQRVASYHALVSDAVTLEVRAQGNTCQLTVTLSREHPPHRQSMLFLLALLAHYSRSRSDSAFFPLQIGLVQPSEEECDALRRFAGCPVVAAPLFHVQFAGADSLAPLKDSDLEIAETLEAVLQNRMQHRTHSYASLLQQWLRLNMGDTHPRLRSAASAFHMSERSLQRRLHAEGVSWKMLVETTRHQVMDPMFSAAGMPITELALTLGYSHATSFSRAFRKRYGMTPRSYRKQVLKATGQRSY